MTEVLITPHETTRPKKAPVTKESFLYAHNILTTTSEGKRIGARQDQERAAIENHYNCEKDAVHCKAREGISIEHMITEAQTMLYGALGIDSKLERNSTLLQFTKGGIDTIIMDNIELVKSIIEHGVEQFLAVFQAMFSVEGIKRMLRETGQSFIDLFTGDAYATGKAFGTIGMGMFGMVKGAVKSEMKHILKESMTARNIRALGEEGAVAPPKIGEMVKGFDPVKVSPKDALSNIQHLNAHLDVTELIHTTGGIRNFIQSLENLAKYIELNAEKIGSLRGEYVQSMIELRKNLKNIVSDPRMPIGEARSLAKLSNDTLEKNIYHLNPHIGPQK